MDWTVLKFTISIWKSRVKATDIDAWGWHYYAQNVISVSNLMDQ